MSVTYLVKYPSGKRLRLTGKLEFVVPADVVDDGATPVIDDGKQLFVLDPRAIVCDDRSGNVIYHPSRAPAETLAPWVRDWLAEHLAWGVAR